ncbi:MAG: bifunctional diguanylate cyclase/phosphodiesterase [Ectothiorhodospira sp.]
MSIGPTIGDIIARGQLHALFQPIVAMDSGQIMGYEGLVRGPSDSQWHAPQKLLAEAARQGRLFDLDVLCRRVILQRYAELGLGRRLFLNINPDVLTDRNAVRGMTLQALQETGIAPEQVVIELTEQQPIHDYGIMREAVNHYRNMGFSIALDDLGAGYSSLRHWSELAPEYVKIDMHFVQNVHNDEIKRQFLHSIREIAHSLGTRLIAEGIETEAEYEVIRALEIPCGQGYYFARPAADPPRSLHFLRGQAGGAAVSRSPFRHAMAGELARRNPVATPDQRLGDTVARFQSASDLRCLPVLEDGRPVGIVRRGEILTLYSQRFTRDLHDRSPLRFFMKRDPLVVPEDQPLEEVSARITHKATGEEEFLIVSATDGRYLGVGWLLELLQRITDLQVRYARYANPLTQLPGNVPIGEHLDRLLQEGRPFTVAYCDLDHFKPFNDHYGYARGDRVIRAMGDLLRGIPTEPDDFIGHVGGDDFILVLTGPDWQCQCRSLLSAFESRVPGFYEDRDRLAGGIATRDRQGRQAFFPLLSLSIGIVPVAPGRFGSHLEIAQRASEVKGLAKAQPGNSLFVDRRSPPAGDVDAFPPAIQPGPGHAGSLLSGSL